MIIIGIDWSSTQLDACLLVPGEPPILRRETLGKAIGKNKVVLEDRLRNVRTAMETLCRPAEVRRRPQVSTQPSAYYVNRYAIDWVCVENAYRNEALQRTLGAIIGSVPVSSKIKILKPREWRAALSAKNTKADGHRVVKNAIVSAHYGRQTEWWELDEHELDAIGIALAWRAILAGQVAA